MSTRRRLPTLMTERRLPSALVAFPFLDVFLQDREHFPVRDWVLDSGAFSVKNSGKTIDLDAYITRCLDLLKTDPTLTEVFALDVIGDPVASAKNCVVMWEAGVPAIPCFHYGEPEPVLMAMAERYPKIALGGVVGLREGVKIKWSEQVFARVWPKKVHGFALAGDRTVLAVPWHSVDSTSWELGPCAFGQWKQFGAMTVWGTDQNLRGEVESFMRLEDLARVRWAKQMKELDTDGPTVRLAVVGARGFGS